VFFFVIEENMALEIKMPQLGESVTEGTIGKWLKQPGDRVEKYEALLEVTTDKVDTEVPSPATGILRDIAAQEGETVRVGALLAVLEDGVEGAGQVAEPVAEPSASNGGAPAVSEPAPERTNTFVSPVVARLVAEHNLDVKQIQGSGQGGRVTKQDVLQYIEMRKAAPAATPAPITPPSAPVPAARSPQPPAPATYRPEPAPAPARAFDDLPEDAEIVPISAMRRSIAEHMVRSRRTAPHVTTVFEVDVSRIMAHRERRKAEFERQGVKLTFTPYFVQATVAALQAVPSVNASYGDDGIVMHGRIHVGVAVALDEGLIVPVLRDADEKNLLGLARAVNDMSSRARSRRLKPDEMQGGTFTITNHGVSGSLFAMPIINQPQAAIMGVGAIQKRAVVISQGGVDAIAIRPMCYLSLTIDHRLLDGATADRFLSAVKQFLEGYGEG
jgi:2-oxoisovalerate dehydrogenase E2 component (dihydrolipoyl transacylase)